MPNLSTNYRSPRVKKFTNYAIKTGMEDITCMLDMVLLQAATYWSPTDRSVGADTAS
jgi:hypothetical protein